MAAVKRPKRRRRRSPGRPKLADVAELESRLLDGALKEFVQHGYGGASLTQIVKAAGVSKTTLYSRYSSKEQLFRAIIRRQLERISGAASLRSAPGRLALKRGLKTYANRMIELSFSGDLLLVNRLIYSESHRFPELGAAAAERSRYGVAQVAEFIRECAAADRIRCRNPEGVAEVFIHMLRGWYVNLMLSNRRPSRAVRERWVERAVQMLIAGRKEW